MWLGLVVFTLVAYVEADGNIAQCPNGCYCQVASSDTQLFVDCGHRIPDIDEEQLSRELDLVLSADHFIQNLTSLSITNSPLTRVPASVCKLVNLTSLNLSNNKLTELPGNCFSKLTKLVTLSVKWNCIIGLQDGLFDGLQSLVTLNLQFNHIAFIGLRVFSNSSDLTSLRSISLANNRLTSLEPWWYYRCILGNATSPVIISLRHNLISNFTNNLHLKFRCGMKRPYGYLDLYRNRIMHVMDIFNGWNIAGDSIFTTMWCLRNFKAGHKFMGFDIGGITYACDCTDFPFYKMAKVGLILKPDLMNDVRCGQLSFYNGIIGRQIQAISIPLSEFVCEIRDRCPSSCQCVYRPANATLHVYCSATNLSSLPLELPPLPKSYVKYKLDFSNNKLLRRLEHRPYFVNTSILDISNCSLSEIKMEVLNDVFRLSLVNLRSNMLQSFPRLSDTVNVSAGLLIGGNPWMCSCENSWMIGWLQSLSHEVSDQDSVVCRSPSRMYGRNMLKSTKEDICVDPIKRYLIIIVSLSVTVATIVFLVIVGLLFYKLRVKFYKKWKFHPFDRDECVGEDMDYDVFLCCSSEDHNPHGLRILREIELKGYRVCYHLRDFLAGAPITENMIQSIERSKRTVCLISENFMRR